MLRNIAGADNAGRVQAVYAPYAMKDRYLTRPRTGNLIKTWTRQAPRPRAGWRRPTSVKVPHDRRCRENENAEG
jgi:hypothetical protein